MVIRQRALARLCLGNRNPTLLDECPQGVRRLGVDGAPAGDDQRALRTPNECNGFHDPTRIGLRPRDVPDAAREKLGGVLVGLRLHILRKGKRYRAGLGLAHEYAHRGECGRNDLLRPLDPVEVARDRLQGIVDGDVAA